MDSEATIRLELNHEPGASGVQNIIVTTDGTYVATCVTGGDEHHLQVYRSHDGGTTWALEAEIEGYFKADRGALIHLPENILLLGGANRDASDEGDAEIYRSLDAGASWSRVANWSKDHPATEDYPEIYGAGSDNRNSATILFNVLKTPSENSLVMARSTDYGASWTPANEPITGQLNAPYGMLRAIGGGKFLLPSGRTYIPDPGEFGDLTVKLSDNRAASWYESDPLPVPAGDWTGWINHIVAFTPEILVAAGYLYSFDDGEQTGLWRSTDGGTTWTKLDASAVPSAPAPPDYCEFLALRRIEQRSALIQWRSTLSNGDVPFAISTDAGENWDLVPTIDGPTLEAATEARARPTTTERGTILTATLSYVGNNYVSRIWEIRTTN